MAPFLRFFKESGLSEAVIKDIATRMSDRFSRFFPGDFDVKHIEGNETFSFDDFTLKVVYSPGHALGSASPKPMGTWKSLRKRGWLRLSRWGINACIAVVYDKGENETDT